MAPLHPRYRTLLANLRAARHKAGLTQVEVADRLKRSQQWVSRSETGQHRIDPIELEELAKLYGTTCAELMPRPKSGS